MEENIQLKEITIDDYSFVYELIKNFLKTNLSVTFLSLPSFDEFKKSYFKNDFMRYIHRGFDEPDHHTGLRQLLLPHRAQQPGSGRLIR